MARGLQLFKGEMVVFLLALTVLLPLTVVATALHTPTDCAGTPVSRSRRTFTEDLGSLLS